MVGRSLSRSELDWLAGVAGLAFSLGVSFRMDRKADPTCSGLSLMAAGGQQ